MRLRGVKENYNVHLLLLRLCFNRHRKTKRAIRVI